MDSMKQKDNILYISVAVALTIGLLVVANAVGIWHIPELWSQILAACMGARRGDPCAYSGTEVERGGQGEKHTHLREQGGGVFAFCGKDVQAPCRRQNELRRLPQSAHRDVRLAHFLPQRREPERLAGRT